MINMKNLLLIPFLLISSQCYSESVFNTVYDVDLPQKALEISYDDKGKIKQVTTNRWTDRVKTDKGRAYRKFEQGYNYHKKQGFNFVYNDKDELIDEVWNENIDGIVSQEELLIAFDLFKKNDLVKSQFAESDEKITIHGGFNFIDSSKCKPGNRCVHVFASTPKIYILAHSVVRLTDSSVIYPDFNAGRNIKNTHKK